MNEKLVIKNFGPIRNIDLDLGKVNILIGEQATGKSTVAKVLAVCRYFSYILDDDRLYFNEPFKEGLEAWGLTESIKEDTYIFYKCKHYSFEVKSVMTKEHGRDEDGDHVEYDYPAFASTLEPLSAEFIDLINELELIKPKRSKGYGFEDIDWTIPYSFFANDVKKVLDNPFYFPTERGLQSVFSLGRGSIPNIGNSLYNYFSKVDAVLNSFKVETKIDPLDISYFNANGKGFVRKDNSTVFFSLTNGASGYQSSIPIVLVIKYQNEIRKKRKTFIIEEPELNLFPSAQDRLMRFLVDNTINYGNTLLLTTHSPYTLTSLNNMMYAFEIGQNNRDEVSKEIEEKYWLNPNDVSAYMLAPDGFCENIFDREEGLIKAEKIDGVSTEINKLFDKLVNIEFKGNDFDI